MIIRKRYQKIICANGFELKKGFENNKDLVLDLVAVSRDIPQFGVTDLIELLQSMARNKTPTMVRPPAITKFLAEEAKNAARTDGQVIKTEEDLKALLSQLITVTGGKLDTDSLCPHDFTIFQKLECEAIKEV
jgi:hypothetical protein